MTHQTNNNKVAAKDTPNQPAITNDTAEEKLTQGSSISSPSLPQPPLPAPPDMRHYEVSYRLEKGDMAWALEL